MTKLVLKLSAHELHIIMIHTTEEGSLKEEIY